MAGTIIQTRRTAKLMKARARDGLTCCSL